MQEKIVLRQVVTLTLALSFFVMSMTGLVLFFAPRGSVANWSDWSFLGLQRVDFVHIHMTNMILFLSIASWHIINNWGALIYYLKNKSQKISLIKKEFLIALTLTMIFTLGAIIGFQPFKSIVDLNEHIKSYWEMKYDLLPNQGHRRP